MEKRYLNLKELCEYAGLKPSQVYWLVYKGKIPHRHLTEPKAGKRQKSPLLFDKIEIDRWFKKGSISMRDIER